jgi:hypothetical protein
MIAADFLGDPTGTIARQRDHRVGSYLKTLSEQAHEPQAFDDSLTKAEASKRIDALKARLAERKSA